MKVTLETYGGLAAAANFRRRPQVLDTADLPEGPATELAGLVAAAIAMPAEADTGRARDARSYKITVEDGGRSTPLEQSDAAMSPAFAALLTWLRRHFEGQ
ncbi:protealysin inhibitor emfourin [Streptomyces kutzneri]|uniref:protealysin inhibitor emfourin n=1 Tax=Streptomyces kutzneri TaxID=3051179 RepID=UPI0028D4BE1D|nr:protealysin inhibitor emfourin [Streptomyces sp. DSM 40907]